MTATPGEWLRAKAIFDAAVLLDAVTRETYLADACGPDDLLRQQVEALLASHDQARTFLDQPVATSAGRTTDTLDGRTIGSYRILSRVGAGGMGEVYRAHDSKLDREVAVKLLPGDVTSNADRLRRFHAEARAASSLNHPNILVIHDFGELNGRPFMVTEIVEGETLRQRIERGVVSLQEAVAIAIQIAGALAAAHARGIVHRDIKPENVMVRPDGYVKVLDFGLAKLADRSTPEAATQALATQAGVLLGTPHYMSPEQAEGKSVDARSDVFSLGIVLYELTAGLRPFTGKTPAAVLTSILRDTPTAVTDVNPSLSPELARIVERCLAKDRDDRYASALDLRSDLERLERAPRRSAHPDTSRIDSLAVLPFANASGDPDTDYLSDGITETLINRLSQIPTLRVVPRSTVFRYKGREIEPADVGRQLRVRALLTGKVLQRGDTLSVQAELVDVRQEAQLWGERLVRRGSDIFAVEDEIARQITENLRLKLTGEERERLARRYTDDTNAYHLYLRGRFHWSRRTGPDLLKSVEYFNEAIAADPDYALPYTGLADAYVVLSAFEGGVPKDLLSKAKAAAGRALAIEPDLAEALTELIIVLPWLDRDWHAADEAYRRAMRRQPVYWLTHDHHAMTLAARGRVDEAIAEVRRGQALEPLSLVVHHHVAWMLIVAGRSDEAIAECQRALDMDASFGMLHLWMGIALDQLGRYGDAIASLERAVALKATRSMSIASAAHAFARSGQIDEARQRLAQLEQESATRYVEPYALALIHAALGDDEAALRLLEQGYRDNSFWLGMLARSDTRLASLRGNARFQDLLHRLGVA
jgi:serine/threonine protein kinase/tetratricopeptide (TPR) repeat protein